MVGERRVTRHRLDQTKCEDPDRPPSEALASQASRLLTGATSWTSIVVRTVRDR